MNEHVQTATTEPLFDPLSPRFISIKARDYSFQHYPVFSRSRAKADEVALVPPAVVTVTAAGPAAPAGAVAVILSADSTVKLVGMPTP